MAITSYAPSQKFSPTFPIRQSIAGSPSARLNYPTTPQKGVSNISYSSKTVSGTGLQQTYSSGVQQTYGSTQQTYGSTQPVGTSYQSSTYQSNTAYPSVVLAAGAGASYTGAGTTYTGGTGTQYTTGAQYGGSTTTYGTQYGATGTTGATILTGGVTGTSTSRASLGQQVVHTSERVDHSQQRVISERVIEHEVRIPKKVTREDYIEKVIVVPEKIVHEEFSEDIQKIRERIVEVAMPIIQEKIVEVPEIEYVDKIVEVPEIVVQEKIREVPRLEIQERIIEVPRPIIQEKIVEVPEVEYRDVPYEKIIEVPEVREQVVIKEIPVPQYIEKSIPEYVDVTQEIEIARNVPVTVEALTTVELTLPRLRAQQKAIDVPLYVPRFVEVPIPADSMDAATIAQAEAYANQVSMMVMSNSISLCDVDTLGANLRQMDFERTLNTTDRTSLIADAFHTGRLQVDQASMAYAASTTETHNTYTQMAPVISGVTTKGSTVISGGTQLLGGASHIVERSSAPVTSTTEVTTIKSRPAVIHGTGNIAYGGSYGGSTSYTTQQIGTSVYPSGSQIYETTRSSVPIRTQIATNGYPGIAGGYTTMTGGYTTGTTVTGTTVTGTTVTGSTTQGALVSSKGTVITSAGPVVTPTTAVITATPAHVTTEKVTTTTTTTTTTTDGVEETVSATEPEVPVDDSINTSGATETEEAAN